VAGECDVSSTPAAVRRIADAIPGARYEVLPGAPHMLFIEQLEATAAVMMRFLGSLPSHRTA
jgi:3-oxoadipate enol-lactonase